MGELYEAVETFLGIYRERYRRVDGAINRNAPMREQVAALNSALHDAARSEAQPSGYDGSKSLGERLYEAIYGEFGPIPWNYLLAHEHALWDHAALTFTASLSDASEADELKGRVGELSRIAMGNGLEISRLTGLTWALGNALKNLTKACEDADAQEELPVEIDGSLLDAANKALGLLSPSSGDE